MNTMGMMMMAELEAVLVAATLMHTADSRVGRFRDLEKDNCRMCAHIF